MENTKSSNFKRQEEYYEHLETYWAHAEEGLNKPINFNVPTQKPSWLDLEKFKRGQKFARDHYLSVQYALLTALCLLYTESFFIRGFIITGKSDTPFKAFKKFLSTSMIFTSWYDGDVWSDEPTSAKAKLERTRRLHKYVQQKFEGCSEEELYEKTSLGDVDEMTARLPLHLIIREDYKNACREAFMSVWHKRQKKSVMLSQTALSGAQLGVMGLAVTYPKHFGLHNATEEELDSFIHFWRGMGYLLGAGDEYNFGNTDLDFVRERTLSTIEVLFKPAISCVHVYWEHMIRCMVDGVQLALPVPIVTFESLVLDISRMIGVPTPGLEKWMSYKQYLSYFTIRFGIMIQGIPMLASLCNWLLRIWIKKAENATPKVINGFKAKKFWYLVDKCSF